MCSTPPLSLAEIISWRMVGGAIVLMGLLLLGAAPGRVRAYHVTHVATLLDESNFLPHIKRAVDSQNHRTVFVRFFLAGQGDRTHRAWEHIANQKHKIHGASFADVDCAESIELKEAHRAGSEGWPMIKYFNWHTGLAGKVYHPPSHVTNSQMRQFVIDVIVDAHTESRRKHKEHLEAKHGIRKKGEKVGSGGWSKHGAEL